MNKIADNYRAVGINELGTVNGGDNKKTWNDVGYHAHKTFNTVGYIHKELKKYPAAHKQW